MTLDFGLVFAPLLAEIRAEGATGETPARCVTCREWAFWIDPASGTCPACSFALWREWERRGGHTSELVAGLLDALPGRHRRLVRAAVCAWWSAVADELGVKL